MLEHREIRERVHGRRRGSGGGRGAPSIQEELEETLDDFFDVGGSSRTRDRIRDREVERPTTARGSSSSPSRFRRDTPRTSFASSVRPGTPTSAATTPPRTAASSPKPSALPSPVVSASSWLPRTPPPPSPPTLHERSSSLGVLPRSTSASSFASSSSGHLQSTLAAPKIEWGRRASRPSSAGRIASRGSALGEGRRTEGESSTGEGGKGVAGGSGSEGEELVVEGRVIGGRV